MTKPENLGLGPGLGADFIALTIYLALTYGKGEMVIEYILQNYCAKFIKFFFLSSKMTEHLIYNDNWRLLIGVIGTLIGIMGVVAGIIAILIH